MLPMYCTQCGSPTGRIPHDQFHIRCPSCGHTTYQNPSPCVSVLIVRDEQVLLTKRGNTSIMPHKWCLPCGHMEGNETFAAAARREVQEETHLEIIPLSVINVVTNHFPGDVHSLVVVVLAEPVSDLLIAGDDSVDAGWFPVEGPFPDMAFQADMHIINHYLQYRRTLEIPLSHTKIDFWE